MAGEGVSFPSEVVGNLVKPMASKQAFTYILTNKRQGTLYIGVSSNLNKRLQEHKEDVFEGFSKKYRLKKLVYYEVFDNPMDAILREKVLKKWNRLWKIRLIEKSNPDWQDLYEDF